MVFWAQTNTITVAWLEMGMDSPMNTMEKINFVLWYEAVELDPDIEEHSPSDPNDALGAPSPEMTKSSEKKEKGMKKAVLGLSFMEKEQEKITL
jgi:hypothetical protein